MWQFDKDEEDKEGQNIKAGCRRPKRKVNFKIKEEVRTMMLQIKCKLLV